MTMHPDDVLANREAITEREPMPADSVDNHVIDVFRYSDGQPDGLTTRQALTLAYGTDWERHLKQMNVADVANRSWYTYVTRPGKTYPDMVWNDTDVIVINYTMGRCVHGYEDVLDVANYRLLTDEWQDCPGLTTGPYSGSSHVSLDLDELAPSNLIDVLERLESYPVLDDDEYSQCEQEMIEEHWESYGKRDAGELVADVLGVDYSDITDYAEETISALTFGGYLDEYPQFIDVSAVEFNSKSVAGWVREHVGNPDPVTVRRWAGDDGLAVDCHRGAWVREN